MDTEQQTPSTATSSAGRQHSRPIPSPLSTGGAGELFEQHVGAYWLAHLLIGAIVPILEGCTLVEVHLQTERLGWHTDDFLVVGQSSTGETRRLAVQAKRTFRVSSSDEHCQKAILDFWRDFRASDLFDPETDRFAIVTLRGTNALLEDFSALLDAARVERSGDEFQSRLAKSGLLSKEAIRYCDEICRIVERAETRRVDRAEIWPFLRVIHILSLDLASSTRQQEANVKTLLAFAAHEQNAHAAAESTWNALLLEAGVGAPEGKSYRRDDLPDTLRQRHAAVGDVQSNVLQALHDHSQLILQGIRSTVGLNRLHLARRCAR